MRVHGVHINIRLIVILQYYFQITTRYLLFTGKQRNPYYADTLHHHRYFDFSTITHGTRINRDTRAYTIFKNIPYMLVPPIEKMKLTLTKTGTE